MHVWSDFKHDLDTPQKNGIIADENASPSTMTPVGKPFHLSGTACLPARREVETARRN